MFPAYHPDYGGTPTIDTRYSNSGSATTVAPICSRHSELQTSTDLQPDARSPSAISEFTLPASLGQDDRAAWHRGRLDLVAANQSHDCDPALRSSAATLRGGTCHTMRRLPRRAARHRAPTQSAAATSGPTNSSSRTPTTLKITCP